MKAISSMYELSARSIKRFSVRLSAWRPPGETVKADVNQEGGEVSSSYGTRMMM
jgi:hypothetical protein